MILDLGCGNGRHTLEACRQGQCQVVAVDLNREDLRRVRFMWARDRQRDPKLGRVEFLIADAQRLPFANSSFDRVICTEVLEHLPDDGAGLRELVRVLKPAGELVVSVPAYLAESLLWRLARDYLNRAGGHIRIYRSSQLIEALRAHGLQPYAFRQEKSFQSVYWLLIGLTRFRKQALLPRLFKGFLHWYEQSPTQLPDLVERIGNHIIPKDMVLYARKGRGQGRSS